MSITRENYYELKEFNGKPLINHSAIKYAYPGEGGSVAKLQNYIEKDDDNDPEDEKKHQRLGKLLHEWLQNPRQFAVEPENAPDAWIQSVLRESVKRYPELKTMGDFMNIFPVVTKEVTNLKWGADVVNKHISEKGDKYFAYLLENNGKKMLTAADKKQLQGMQSGIENSIYAEYILEDKNCRGDILKEFPYMWEENSIWYKLMLDRASIDWTAKAITIDEIKTTSEPVDCFFQYKKAGFDESNNYTHVLTPGPALRYKYYRQLPFYGGGLKHFIASKGFNPYEFSGVLGYYVVESVEPFEVRRYVLNNRLQHLAQIEISESKTVIAEYYAKKKINGF